MPSRATLTGIDPLLGVLQNLFHDGGPSWRLNANPIASWGLSFGSNVVAISSAGLALFHEDGLRGAWQ